MGALMITDLYRNDPEKNLRDNMCLCSMVSGRLNKENVRGIQVNSSLVCDPQEPC